jgi:hypothetical protein
VGGGDRPERVLTVCHDSANTTFIMSRSRYVKDSTAAEDSRSVLQMATAVVAAVDRGRLPCAVTVLSSASANIDTCTSTTADEVK